MPQKFRCVGTSGLCSGENIALEVGDPDAGLYISDNGFMMQHVQTQMQL